MIRLCAFLGNHGPEYKDNRHNVAWLFLKTLGFAAGLSWTKKFKGRYAFLDGDQGRLHIVMPETYMNASGQCVSEAMRFHKVGIDELLVVHDELELPLGYFSFKRGGGLGGHNGLRSLKESLGSAEFFRLRFGIGRPDHSDVAAYVLSDFLRPERLLLEEQVFPKAAEALDLCLRGGFETVETAYRKVRADAPLT